MKNKDQTFTLLDFFSNLIHPLVDTYLVTLTAIDQICGKNLVLSKKKFVTELHNCIKALFSTKVLTHLHSCLNEIIETAIERFSQMGFLEMRAYVTKNGSTTVYLQCPAESKSRIDELWN